MAKGAEGFSDGLSLHFLLPARSNSSNLGTPLYVGLCRPRKEVCYDHLRFGWSYGCLFLLHNALQKSSWSKTPFATQIPHSSHYCLGDSNDGFAAIWNYRRTPAYLTRIMIEIADAVLILTCLVKVMIKRAPISSRY